MPYLDSVQEAVSASGMEFDFEMVCIVVDDVFLSQGAEVAACAAGGEGIFHGLSVDSDAEGVLAVLLLPLAAQQVGCGAVPAVDVGEEQFYFVNTLGHVEAVAFKAVAQGLEQRAVGRQADFGLRARFLAAEMAPAARGVGLVGNPGQVTLVGGEEAMAAYVDGKFQSVQIGFVQPVGDGGETYPQSVRHRLA